MTPSIQTRGRRALAAGIVGLSALAAGLCAGPGCTQHGMVDTMISSAYRPPIVPRVDVPAEAPPGAKRFVLLAGDMHCHVSPPDDPSDVSRGLAETLTLARKEGLDFVVLTPHVWSRFFMDPGLREAVTASQARLREELARTPSGDVLFIPGMEYTDHAFGHVGVSFADVDRVLADVPLVTARRHPERFFERWVARGGLLVVNHPLVTPLDSVISIARADLSWRPFTRQGPFPPEIEAVDRLAQGFEAFNLTVTQLRDRYLVGDTERSLRATLELLDREIPRRHRRMTPLGGSDSHSHHLRATTFVLAEGRTEAAIKDAVISGRTCVRDPDACSFEARIATGPWTTVGGALDRGPSALLRAHGRSIDIFSNGEVVASPASDEVVRIPLPRDGCTVLRARVGEGFSGPIYAGCAL